MLDLGWSELLMIAVITVIVVGPRELPRVLRTVTQGIKKIRGIAGEFQSGIEDMAREADLQDLKRDLENGNLENTIADTVDPTGEVASTLKETKQDLDSQKDDLNEASKAVQFSARDAMSSGGSTSTGTSSSTDAAETDKKVTSGEG